jgi:hypothetical protein
LFNSATTLIEGNNYMGNYPHSSLLSLGGIRPGGAAAAGGEIPPELVPFDGAEVEIGGGENGAGFGKAFDASVWVTRPICGEVDGVDDERRILIVVGGGIGEREGGDGGKRLLLMDISC